MWFGTYRCICPLPFEIHACIFMLTTVYNFFKHIAQFIEEIDSIQYIHHALYLPDISCRYWRGVYPL
jgi:hypothetical protein